MVYILNDSFRPKTDIEEINLYFYILGEDFSVKEMRKTYEIPENASFDHMTSFLTAKGLYLISIRYTNKLYLFRYIGCRISINYTN